MAAALGYLAHGSAARLCFHLQQPSYNTDRLIAVLEQLAGFYAGQRAVLIWDGLSAHWSTKMRAFLDSQRDWLRAERLPAYAPSSTRSSTCGPTSRTSSWRIGPRPPWPRSPTPPNKASNASASTTAW
jgi:DDE superfamily endonuclease